MSFSNSIDKSFLIALVILICAAVFAVLCLRQLVGKLSPKKTAVFMGMSLFVICICVVFIVMSDSPSALFAPAAGTGSIVTGENVLNGIHDVRIREDDIYLDGVKVEGVSALAARLEEIRAAAAGDSSEGASHDGSDDHAKAVSDAPLEIVLTDDHAAALTWHDVENALSDSSITWKEVRR